MAQPASGGSARDSQAEGGSVAPYCFFNLDSPLISLAYGFSGFRIERIPPAEGEAPPITVPTSDPGLIEGGSS